MKHSVHLCFAIELQPGRYTDIEQRISDLTKDIEDRLTSEYDHIVGSVIDADWDLTISPD